MCILFQMLFFFFKSDTLEIWILVLSNMRKAYFTEFILYHC